MSFNDTAIHFFEDKLVLKDREFYFQEKKRTGNCIYPSISDGLPTSREAARLKLNLRNCLFFVPFSLDFFSFETPAHVFDSVVPDEFLTA